MSKQKFVGVSSGMNMYTDKLLNPFRDKQEKAMLLSKLKKAWQNLRRQQLLSHLEEKKNKLRKIYATLRFFHAVWNTTHFLSEQLQA